MMEAKRKKTFREHAQEKALISIISLIVGGGSGLGGSFLKQNVDLKDSVHSEVVDQLQPLKDKFYIIDKDIEILKTNRTNDLKNIDKLITTVDENSKTFNDFVVEYYRNRSR